MLVVKTRVSLTEEARIEMQFLTIVETQFLAVCWDAVKL